MNWNVSIENEKDYSISIIDKKNSHLALVITIFAILFVSTLQFAIADPLDVVEWDSTSVTMSDSLFFDVRETLGDIDCTETGGPIFVTITSTRPGVGVIDSISLEAVEIDDSTPGLRSPTPGTCIFGNIELYLIPDDRRFPIDNTVTVTQDDNKHGEDTDDTVTTKDLTLISTSDPSGITLTLTETGPNTGIFQNQLLFTSDVSVNNINLHVEPGDIVTTNYQGRLSYSQMLPSPSGSKGVLVANEGDAITVTYNGVSADAEVCFCFGGGGSSGGLVISRIVLDFLGGTTGDHTPPQLILNKLSLANLPLVGDILDFIQNADPFTIINPLEETSIDYPVSINGNGYLLTQYANTIKTYTGKTGEPISFKGTLFDATGVDHIGLYTNLRGYHREIQDSDTFVIYNEGIPLEITDPHGFFSNVNFTESEYNGKYIAYFNMTFAKPMNTSDIIIRTWDELRNSGDIKIFDAIKIEGEPIVNPDTNNLILPESTSMAIPYYKMPFYEIPNADLDGTLIYYNSFGGLEKKQTQPHHEPTIYPENIGKDERHDDRFYEKLVNEETRAQTVMQSLIGNPFSTLEDNNKEMKFNYPSSVGKLVREDVKKLNNALRDEYVKAAITAKRYMTNQVDD